MSKTQRKYPKTPPAPVAQPGFSYQGLRLAIVRSRYNEAITQGLLEGAMATLQMAGVSFKNVMVVHVPGALEIPAVVSRLAATRRWDGIITLGCVIRGETEHHHYINRSVSQALMDLSLSWPIPIVFGVLTPNSVAQAKARALGKPEHNKGREAAMALLEMAALYGKLKKVFPLKVRGR